MAGVVELDLEGATEEEEELEEDEEEEEAADGVEEVVVEKVEVEEDDDDDADVDDADELAVEPAVFFCFLVVNSNPSSLNFAVEEAVRFVDLDRRRSLYK